MGGERREVRRFALLTQRAADLRALADNLTEIASAAKEIAWERTATEKLMPRSDPRAIRLTELIHRNRFLRRVVGDDEDTILRSQQFRRQLLTAHPQVRIPAHGRQVGDVGVIVLDDGSLVEE